MLNPIMNFFFDATHARSIRSQPSVVMAIGFSEKTCANAWPSRHRPAARR